MLNQLVLVGRLVDNPTVEELEDGRKVSKIKVITQRSYKDNNGEDISDTIPVTIWEGIATNVAEYCHKGDIIGIKGRIEETKDNIIVVAEKVTFLSSKKEKDN